jgi:hypothetical protein
MMMSGMQSIAKVRVREMVVVRDMVVVRGRADNFLVD